MYTSDDELAVDAVATCHRWRRLVITREAFFLPLLGLAVVSQLQVEGDVGDLLCIFLTVEWHDSNTERAWNCVTNTVPLSTHP